VKGNQLVPEMQRKKLFFQLHSPGPQPGFKVWGQNIFLGGHVFCFYYVFVLIK